MADFSNRRRNKKFVRNGLKIKGQTVILQWKGYDYMFVKNADVKPQPCGEGVTRKILAHGGGLMMVEVSFKKGAADCRQIACYKSLRGLLRGAAT